MILMLNLKMNKMKKISIISLLLLLSFSTVFGQKKNIVNAALYLKTSQKSKGDDIVKNIKDAKKYIDEAYNNESTSNDPKMWNYRSKIYLQIAIKHSQLDDNAIFKATEAAQRYWAFWIDCFAHLIYNVLYRQQRAEHQGK